MKDQVTLDRINLLHPKIKEEIFKIYDEIIAALNGSAICRFTHTLRTFAEQDALYAQGRTKAGSIVTKARGGQSYHNYGLAIDIVLLVNPLFAIAPLTVVAPGGANTSDAPSTTVVHFAVLTSILSYLLSCLSLLYFLSSL